MQNSNKLKPFECVGAGDETPILYIRAGNCSPSAVNSVATYRIGSCFY